MLASAVGSGEPLATDALRVIRHELRRKINNKKATIWPRPTAVNEVIVRCAERGELPPKNASPEALHADHVHPLTSSDLHDHHGVDDWLRRLAEMREVVCVTAEENYRLQVLEKSGVTGWDKYQTVGITWASDVAHEGPSVV